VDNLAQFLEDDDLSNKIAELEKRPENYNPDDPHLKSLCPKDTMSKAEMDGIISSKRYELYKLCNGMVYWKKDRGWTDREERKFKPVKNVSMKTESCDCYTDGAQVVYKKSDIAEFAKSWYDCEERDFYIRCWLDEGCLANPYWEGDCDEGSTIKACPKECMSWEPEK